MLKKSVALVTGSVNGLGRHTFERLFKEGARVFGCDIRDDQGSLTKTCKGAGFFRADVRSEKEMEEVIRQTIDLFGRLDILVHCAGIASAYKIYTSTNNQPGDIEDITRVVEINILGTFNVNRLAAVQMSKNNPNGKGERGIIINTSGFAADQGRLGQGALGASYGAINSMTLPMSRDLAPLGIRVNTISPGLFDTPLTSSFDKPIRTFLERTQIHPYRFGNPSEYSDLVLHIIQNGMINGEVLQIDAGLRLPGY